MTVPNLITSLRVILVPIFVIYLLDDRLTAALIVFVVAGVSDGVDGFIARAFNQKSQIGAFLDPLADKILLVAAFITLAARGFIPVWLTVVAISRDVLILLGVLILFITRHEVVMCPSVVSKITTFFQLLSIFVVLSDEKLHLRGLVGEPVFWVTAALTVASGLHYGRYWFRKMSEEETPRL